jgi:hypothetical protein
MNEKLSQKQNLTGTGTGARSHVHARARARARAHTHTHTHTQKTDKTAQLSLSCNSSGDNFPSLVSNLLIHKIYKGRFSALYAV